MRFAQLHAKHIAYQQVMQVAYDENMEKVESPRRTRRRARLDELILSIGSAAQLARESGTPKSHISAMQAGKRGVGDEMAGKLEALYGTPQGWFDAQDTPSQSTLPALLPPPNTPPALAGRAGGAINLETCIEGLARSLMQSDPVDRAAAKAYLIGLCDAPDRLDLRDKIRATLEPPPAQKHTPETGTQRAA